jgi:hypothetical protein
VLAQVCSVRTADGTAVQGAVIVRNNRSSIYGALAGVELYDSDDDILLGNWDCAGSGAGAHSWSVCFGTAFSWPWAVFAAGYAW